MHKIEIPAAGIVIDFPENIYELTTEQYHYYCQLVVMLHRAHINEMEFKVMFTYYLMNMTYTGIPSESKMMNLALIMEKLEGFFKVGEGTISPITDCAANLAGQFYFKDAKYVGPANALADVTIGQLLDGLTLSNAFAAEQKRVYLEKLFATFHTFRKRFLKKDVPVSEARAATLEDYHLYGFYFFFTSAVNFLTSQDVPLADGRTYNFAPLFKEESKSDSVGPVAVLFELAHNGVFGTIEKTRDVNAVTALIYMLDQHYASERLKSKK